MHIHHTPEDFLYKVKKHAHIKDVFGAILGMYILTLLASFLFTIFKLGYELIILPF